MLRFRHPSPAMGVAVFALFVALGGASVAATNDFLPRNSVGTAQIQNNSVTRAKIAHQSITNVLIKPGSLMASSFAAGQIPAGPKGDTGAAGQAGPKGATGAQGPAGVLRPITVVTRDVVVQPGTSATVSVIDMKHQAIAGGTSWAPDAKGLLATVSLRPVVNGSGRPIGYEATGYNGTGVVHTFRIHVSFG